MKCLFTEVMDYDYLLFLYFATIVAPALLLAAFYAHIYRVVLKQVQYL
jgi:adenosine receptor A2a